MARSELYFCHLNLEVSGQVATIISVLGTGSPCLLVCTRMAFFPNWIDKTLSSGRNLRGKGSAFFGSRW